MVEIGNSQREMPKDHPERIYLQEVERSRAEGDLEFIEKIREVDKQNLSDISGLDYLEKMKS